MKVGDLVKYAMGVHEKYIGIVTCIDPEELGDLNEVEVAWHTGEVSNHSACFLEVINESR